MCLRPLKMLPNALKMLPPEPAPGLKKNWQGASRGPPGGSTSSPRDSKTPLGRPPKALKTPPRRSQTHPSLPRKRPGRPQAAPGGPRVASKRPPGAARSSPAACKAPQDASKKLQTRIHTTFTGCQPLPRSLHRAYDALCRLSKNSPDIKDPLIPQTPSKARKGRRHWA